MQSRIFLLAIVATLPLSVVSQAATTSAASSLPTAIVPFGTLPTCAQLCGPLFDAQGACTPPTHSSVDTGCFCKYATLQPFFSGSTGVCANVQGGCTGSDLSTVQNWFLGLCGAAASSISSLTAEPTITASGTGGMITSTATSAPSPSGNSSWLNSHWQYVVMIVVIVLAIIFIWVGACCWRRRYLRKKELQYELRPPTVPWAENSLKAGPPYGFADGTVAPGAKGKGTTPFTMTSAVAHTEKPAKKKWVVRERT